jgi:hypothetical protein
MALVDRDVDPNSAAVLHQAEQSPYDFISVSTKQRAMRSCGRPSTTLFCGSTPAGRAS